jgi:hypothetical protein
MSAIAMRSCWPRTPWGCGSRAPSWLRRRRHCLSGRSRGRTGRTVSVRNRIPADSGSRWAPVWCASAGRIPFAALGPDESETSEGLQDKFPKTDAFGYVALADGRLWLLPEGVSCFTGDLTEEEQQVVGHSYSACRGFVRSASAGHRVAVQAELVHRGQ